jgi:hypothetical protein
MLHTFAGNFFKKFVFLAVRKSGMLQKVHYYFNSYTTYEKPKKNRNRRRRSQHLRQQAIKEEGTDQNKKAIKGEAALEVKEEEKFLDKEP